MRESGLGWLLLVCLSALVVGAFALRRRLRPCCAMCWARCSPVRSGSEDPPPTTLIVLLALGLFLWACAPWLSELVGAYGKGPRKATEYMGEDFPH